jgi:hypothetical protein
MPFPFPISAVLDLLKSKGDSTSPGSSEFIDRAVLGGEEV